MQERKAVCRQWSGSFLVSLLPAFLRGSDWILHVPKILPFRVDISPFRP